MGVAKDSSVGNNPFEGIAAAANARPSMPNRPYNLNVTIARLNQIRADFLTAATAVKMPGYQYCVSGPWPVGSPFMLAITTAVSGNENLPGTRLGPFRDLSLYFEDTGTPPTFTAESKARLQITDPDFALVDQVGLGSVCRTFTATIFVGGNVPVHITGQLIWNMIGLIGAPPLLQSEFSLVTNMPGVQQPTISGPAAFANVDATVNPGEYTFTASVTAEKYIFYFAQPQQPIGPAMGGELHAVYNFSGPTVPVNAIHGTKNVLKVDYPQTQASGQFPFGLHQLIYTGTLNDIQFRENIGGVNYFTRTKNGVESFGAYAVRFLSSQAGLFTAMVPPINGLALDQTERMPWNVISQTPETLRVPPYERDVDPPTRWRANTVYTVGIVALDSNGHLQEVTLVSGLGKSGATEPAWGTEAGSEVVEIQSSPASRVEWRLKRVWGYNRAVHRMFTISIYPFKWRHEPLGETSPSKVTDITRFRPAGWWIYRVHLNRAEQFTTDVAIPATTSIPVTLGCIRNGVFVPFGTWQTGDVVDAMWPVFTNDQLVYDAAERLDIQASVFNSYFGIIQANGKPFGVLGNISYPILANHYNDMEAALALLPFT